MPAASLPSTDVPDLPALVARHAGLTPDALAVTDGDTTLTYAQLASGARRLTSHLTQQGVRPGDRVALLMPRSAHLIVTQLALWGAGAVCVPLDPAHPRPRTEAMLADAGVTLTVGDGKLLESAGGGGRSLALSPDAWLNNDDTPLPDGDAATGHTSAGDTPLPDGDTSAGVTSTGGTSTGGTSTGGTSTGGTRDTTPSHSKAHGAAGPGPDATAFIMFTSGSTGRPKGVAVRHGAVAELVTDPSYFTVTPRDRVLLHSPATFDASTFEVWAALANGAAVVVCTTQRPSFEDLVREVERHGVTVAFFTTALFHQLAARQSRVFSVLRTVVVGGETLSAQHARAVLRAFPWLELVNGYGPTETTTFATAHRVTDADCDGPVPIGRSVAGASAHILDANRQMTVDGERGELWIGGTRLAAGYVGQSALTAERFIEHPSLGRLYRTGDLVSARPDGVLDFHGRSDDQVKIRGHRIEPGEIAHILRQQPEVADAAVTVRRPAPDDARLAAFVVAGPAPVRAQTLRERLTELLPDHLVPDELTVIDRLPLTSAGKVDLRALAALDPAAPRGEAESLTPLQQAVAEVWSRSLECEVTRPDDDFLALGGHSLLALVVTDDLREDLGVELSLADFFATPTVAGQAALVERALLAAHSDSHPDAPEHTHDH